MKQPTNLKTLLGLPFSRYEKFHKSTNIVKLIKPVPKSKWPPAWKKIYYKGYNRLDQLILPPPRRDDSVSLFRALFERKSSRIFSKMPVKMQSLSTLLYFSSGINKKKRPDRRFYPSAGGRFPLEIYLISLNCEITNGIYHYNIPSHCLEKLALIQTLDFQQYFNQKWISKAACLILISSVFKRTTVKYGNRGYRYILIETGHLAQNLYLCTTALNLTATAIGGFNDGKINKLLDIDGVNESVVYILAVGNINK